MGHEGLLHIHVLVVLAWSTAFYHFFDVSVYVGPEQ